MSNKFIGNNGSTYKNKIDFFNEKYVVNEVTKCWEWIASKNPKGYGHFSLYGKQYQAHRASWELHKGTIPDGMFVLHICNNPSCVNPDHLYLGTNQDNMDYMVKSGNSTRGAKSFTCKLTEQDVLEIRASKLRAKELAQKYNVFVGTIYAIKEHRGWKWL